MTAIPANTVSPEELSEWYQVQEQLGKLKARELILRKRIFSAYFTAPKEGTNNYPLSDGWVLKGKYVINRDVDPGALDALREPLFNAGIRVGELVQYKPSLVMSAYRGLTHEQQQLFDQALIVKEGTPALEIVLPKKAQTA